MQPRLLAVSVATPALCRSQVEIEQTMAQLWNLKGVALQRWKRIIEGTGIERRYGVMPPEDVIGLTTAQRMQAYERLAPPLAAEAALRAIQTCGITADRITELIVVSCTGMSAPGVDVALIERLGLRPTVRRSMIGFMGCFGGISGLRAAVGACAADPDAVALVVCVELCSLHMRAQSDAQSQVAAALFSDGAAAAIVASGKRFQEPFLDISPGDGTAHTKGFLEPFSGPRLTVGTSLLLPEGKDWMSWRITDTGFAMTLTRDVPVALRDAIGEFVAGAALGRPATLIVHPGGPGILDAVDGGLNLQGACGLDAARFVLQQFGNMSSGTILFVLHEALRRGCRLPALMLAFGPGLTIESMQILSAQPAEASPRLPA
ncbi:MAG: type III polyketide synthase [Phycisphaerales bacterium]|nr:type III polyketide synthase [Phycisphaerales bacterium]MCI0631300.1 type III polyketide synthase [Phycisphaerales bacterium]MCI0675278.1 type III polyketide synthase [Phycisphaerales bacterium]